MRSNSHDEVKGRKAPRAKNQEPERDPGRGPGTLTIVSLGPGDAGLMAPKAAQALQAAEVIVGYKTYIQLMDPLLLQGKEVISTGMKAEMERCQSAIERAQGGQRVAIVSSGDAGIYGMAGLILELCRERECRVGSSGEQGMVDFVLEVVPGIPALAAGAALLGAPLMHDFASISLSDLLTPWEVIERRVALAAEGDFVIVLYNPKSKKRDWQLAAVREIVLKYRPRETPVGIVQKAARDGESTVVTSLAEMLKHAVDMQTIVIIGNSHSMTYGTYMITPRGYLKKFGTD